MPRRVFDFWLRGLLRNLNFSLRARRNWTSPFFFICSFLGSDYHCGPGVIPYLVRYDYKICCCCCRSLPAFLSALLPFVASISLFLLFRYLRMRATLYGVLRTTPFYWRYSPLWLGQYFCAPCCCSWQRGTLLSLVYCFVGSLIPGTLFCKPSALGTQRRHSLRRHL